MRSFALCFFALFATVSAVESKAEASGPKVAVSAVESKAEASGPKVAVSAVESKAEASGPKVFECPKGLHQRTPEQVFADHNAALAAGNFDLAMCDYTDDAVVLTGSTMLKGKAEIRYVLELFWFLFGHKMPTVLTQSVHENVLFITFTVDGEIASIPEGADTYVIEKGLIRTQTAHDPLVFKTPPAL
jgi:hypothetical protein